MFCGKRNSKPSESWKFDRFDRFPIGIHRRRRPRCSPCNSRMMSKYHRGSVFQHRTLPKIIMSSEYTKDEIPQEKAFDVQVHGDAAVGQIVLNSPEITCSPSPCVFSPTPKKSGGFQNGLSPPPSPGERTPSPGSDSFSVSPRPRRKSLSPFTRSASPGSDVNSRRASTSSPSGYDLYWKDLLEVPPSFDYADPSSDDLSSEWESDANDLGRAQKTKVRIVLGWFR